MAGTASLETEPEPRTIDEVTDLLAGWAGQVTGGARVSLAPPDVQPDALHVNVYLLDLVHNPPLRGLGPLPLQVTLRYLISAWGPEPAAAHRALHRLVFDALERPDRTVEAEPVPAALWSALGVPPRPAFLLRVPLRVERYEPNVPLVRRSDVRPSLSFPTLHGRLLVPGAGPEGETLALSGARVEVRGTRHSTTSDRGGYFRLENVRPGDDGVLHLTVQARGHTFELAAHEMGTAGAPATIELPWPTARLVGRLQDGAGNPVPSARIELPERRQYVQTRADGRFTLDGLPPDVDPARLVARQGGERLDAQVQEGVVVLTGRDGAPDEPVVIQLKENGG